MSWQIVVVAIVGLAWWGLTMFWFHRALWSMVTGEPQIHFSYGMGMGIIVVGLMITQAAVPALLGWWLKVLTQVLPVTIIGVFLATMAVGLIDYARAQSANDKLMKRSASVA